MIDSAVKEQQEAFEALLKPNGERWEYCSLRTSNDESPSYVIYYRSSGAVGIPIRRAQEKGDVTYDDAYLRVFGMLGDAGGSLPLTPTSKLASSVSHGATSTSSVGSYIEILTTGMLYPSTVHRRVGYRCANCGTANLTLHPHLVVFLSRGGTNYASNRTILCKKYHSSF